MNRTALLPAVLCLLLAAPAAAQHRDANQPDSDIDVRRYSFDLTVSDESDEISGSATIDAAVLDPSEDTLVLNLVGDGRRGMRVTSVSVDGEPATFDRSGDRLRIALGTNGRDGSVSVEVSYRGVPQDGLIISENRHGDRTFFGDNWPNRARHWLPVVDHPADKAAVDWTIRAPDHYQVVGSGRLVERTDSSGGMRITKWSTDVPMATKVMVVGIARFAVEVSDTVHGVPVSSWVYPQERENGFYDYALAAPITRYFIDRIGEFPYEKLANVQSKTRFGGMENASNIFYAEGSVTGTRASEGLIAHEVAHQWFGDSVSENDWHHIWLSEGFATYFTQLWMEHAYGARRLRTNMQGLAETVKSYADANPDSPVVDPSITNLLQLLSPNSYQKGGWVLHMLRGVVGDEAFWSGIRDFYRGYRDGNADTDTFREVMEAASGQDLTWFFDQWIYQPGYPTVAFSSSWSADALTLDLEQTGDDELFFRLPITVEFKLAGETVRREVSMTERRQTFRIELPSAPESIVMDPDTWLLADFTRSN